MTLCVEMLTSPEQIAEDVGQFKLGSFLKVMCLWHLFGGV